MANSTLPQFNIINLDKLIADGQIFYIEFIKRSTGELRKMRCRKGVKRYLKGGSKSYNPKAKNLITVFDMDKGAYRSIPVEGVQCLTVSGQSFVFGGKEGRI